MSEIPQDIREKAIEIAKSLMGPSWWTTGVEEVETALHAERLATEARVREECATIADDYDQAPSDDTPMGPLMAAQVAIAQTIAAAIRETAR